MGMGVGVSGGGIGTSNNTSTAGIGLGTGISIGTGIGTGMGTGRRGVALCHTLGWRDVMDVAVRWRQVSEPGDAVWWVDRMPTRAFQEGYGLQVMGMGITHMSIYMCVYTGIGVCCYSVCMVLLCGFLVFLLCGIVVFLNHYF